MHPLDRTDLGCGLICGSAIISMEFVSAFLDGTLFVVFSWHHCTAGIVIRALDKFICGKEHAVFVLHPRYLSFMGSPKKRAKRYHFSMAFVRHSKVFDSSKRVVLFQFSGLTVQDVWVTYERCCIT